MAPVPLSINDMEMHPPYGEQIKTKAYEAELRLLQIELLKLQRSVREEGRRIVILFEGRDAAGKGGSIKRFMENLNPRGGRVVARSDPLRRWKLSPIDEASLGHFDDYTEARNAMFFYTDTPESPWTVVNSNEKKRARLESIHTVLHSLDYDHKDDAVAHAPDPKVVRPAATLDIPEDDDPLAHGGGPAAS